MPSQWETVRKSAVTLRALEVFASLSLDDTYRRCRAPAIADWCELIANAVEQLAEACDQLQLPLRELPFPPLQRLPFLHQRAKRLDECLGHERLHASSEVRCLPDHSTGKIPPLQAIEPPREIAHMVVLAKVELARHRITLTWSISQTDRPVITHRRRGDA